ncbi:BldC family transcriptional regulator [Spirillospora sp. CA-108201]
MLRPNEVANFFRVDTRTVCGWADAGKLASVRTPGGHRRFSRQQVQHFLDRGEQQAG